MNHLCLAEAGRTRTRDLYPLIITQPCPVCADDELFFCESSSNDRAHDISFRKGLPWQPMPRGVTYSSSGCSPGGNRGVFVGAPPPSAGSHSQSGLACQPVRGNSARSGRSRLLAFR